MIKATMVAVLFVLLGVMACSREPDYSGVGPWSVTRTKLKDATGICQPTELSDGRIGTWCFKQKPFGIGVREPKAAAVDLYFLGKEPTAPLIELQLNVRGCDEEDIEAWLRKNFGDPYERRGTRAFWKMKNMFLAAFLPQEPGRCVLRMLPLSEGSEIERMKLL